MINTDKLYAVLYENGFEVTYICTTGSGKLRGVSTKARNSFGAEIIIATLNHHLENEAYLQSMIDEQLLSIL